VRRFAFSYYVGVLILVFFLYAGFLKAVLIGVDADSSEFCFGVTVGALAMIAILVAIGVAWKER